MRHQIKTSVETILNDRYLTVLLGVFLASSLGLLLFLGLSIHPSELQVVVHYTGFGTTNFYRDKWYYLLTFGLFVIFAAVLHVALTYKLLQAKGRSLAVAFVWLGFLMLLIAAVFFGQILKIASLS
jgi:hypothetical protein